MLFNFKVINHLGDIKYWKYNNITNKLYDDKNVLLNPGNFDLKRLQNGPIRVSRLEVNLGLNCNLKCDYCFQQQKRKEGDGTNATRLENISKFIGLLKKNSEYIKLDRVSDQIIFWGGEPFVYWKTLKLLIPELRQLYPNARFVIPTNGTIITDEIVDFCLEYNVLLNISDDGNNFKRFQSSSNKQQFEQLRKLFEYGLAKLNVTVTKNNANVLNIIQQCNNHIDSLPSIRTKNVSRCYTSTGDVELDAKLFKFTDEELTDLFISRYKETFVSLWGFKPIPSTIILKHHMMIGYPVRIAHDVKISKFDILNVDMDGNIYPDFTSMYRDKIMGHLDNLLEANTAFYSLVWNRPYCMSCPVATLCGKAGISCSHYENSIGCPNQFASNSGMFKAIIKHLYDVYILEMAPCDPSVPIKPVNALLNKIPYIPEEDIVNDAIIPMMNIKEKKKKCIRIKSMYDKFT